MPSPNPEIVCRAFSLMENGRERGTNAQSLDKKLMELRGMVPSSFVDGHFMVQSAMQTEPWLHCEDKPMEQTYWKNVAASSSWSALSQYERAQCIEKLAGVLDSEGAKLAEMESAFGQVCAKRFISDILPFLSSYVRYYSGWAGLIGVECKQLQPQGCIIVDVRKSVFPLLQAIWALTPALAAGNTVNVLATQRAESVLHVARCSALAGLPAGVVNVVVSDTPQVASIVQSPSVVFSPFQSTRNMGAECFVQHGKSSFSLHGRSHMLVLRHADCEAAVEAVISAAAYTSALTAWPLTEVLVEEHLYTNFVKLLKMRLASLEVTSLPPSQWSDQHLNAVRMHSAEEKLMVLEKEGAVLLIGGRSPEPSNTWEAEGCKLPVSVLPVRSHAEALSIVGSRPRTVTASVWTEDGALALQVAMSLKLSLVWLNQHGTLPGPGARFGGWHGAQFGGKEGLFSFLQCVPGEQAQSSLAVKSHAVSKGESQSLIKLPLFCNGGTHKGAGADLQLSDVKDKPFALTSLACSKDVDVAVSAAYKAASSWAARGAAGRGAVLKCLAEALGKQQASYEALLTAAGSDAAAARREVQAAKNAIFKWICRADKIPGEMLGDGRPANSSLVTRQPLGVIAIGGDGPAFTSLGNILSLVAPAVVLGNTVVLGAAKSNPLPALAIAQTLLLQAPLPPGVLNILSCDVEGALAAHSDVAAYWGGVTYAQLTSATFKRVWRVPANMEPALCPEDWMTYQACKTKTICL